MSKYWVSGFPKDTHNACHVQCGAASAANDTMALLAHALNVDALVTAMTLPAFCSFAFFLFLSALYA
jgi:hypothetical protein